MPYILLMQLLDSMDACPDSRIPCSRGRFIDWSVGCKRTGCNPQYAKRIPVDKTTALQQASFDPADQNDYVQLQTCRAVMLPVSRVHQLVSEVQFHIPASLFSL